MQILITGGAGFIGANLVRACEARDHQITVLDDLSTGYESNLAGTNAHFVRGSITDPEAIDTAIAGADAVVHLAARGSVPRSIDDPIATHHVNATGTLNVLDAARRSGGPQVIMASSSSVYGANPELPKREAAATRPMSPYAASKLAGEGYLLAYGRSYAMPTLAFRFFNVFGRFQTAGHAYAAVIPAFIDAALRGKPLVVHGDGTQSRDFTHVDTVCAAITGALEARTTSPDPINLAFGSRTSLHEVIEVLSAQLNECLLIEHIEDRVGDVAHSQADSSSLHQLFPNLVPIDFCEGLIDTIRWMRTQVADSSLNRSTATGLVLS